MDRERIDALWDRYLAGESLSPEEDRDLLQAMSTSEDLRADLIDEEQIDLTLAALGRSRSDQLDFVTSFTRRLDLEGDKANFVGEFKARMARRTGTPRRPPGWLLTAAAALLAVAVETVLVLPRRAPAAPRIAQVRGTVLRLPDRTAVASDQELLSGQGLEAKGTASGADLIFADGTRVTLAGDTTLARVEESDKGKRVSVSKGTVQAVVSGQLPQRPMIFTTSHGDATVLGTELRIVVDPDPQKGARLEVEKGKVELRNLEGKSIVVVSGHCAVAAAGADLVSRPMAPTAYLHRFALLEKGLPPFELTPFGGNCVRFSPDGRLLGCALGDGPIRLWDVASGKIRRTIPGKEEIFRSIAFARDGKRLFAGSDGRLGGLRAYEVETGLRVEELSTHQVRGLALSPDGAVLSSVGARGTAFTVELCDVATSTSRTLQGLDDVIHCTAFSPDGRLVAAGGRQHLAKWWDVATGQERGSGGMNIYHIVSMAFSPDGSFLATSGGAGGLGPNLKFWDLRTGQPRAFVGETRGKDLFAVAFSPDRSTFAAGYGDGAIDLWDATSGKKAATLREGRGPIFGMDFAPDSRSLASVSSDGAVHLWRVSSRGD